MAPGGSPSYWTDLATEAKNVKITICEIVSDKTIKIYSYIVILIVYSTGK